MIKLLDFDTQILGYRVAKFFPNRLNQSTAQKLLQECRKQKIHCLYAEFDAGHFKTLETAARHGFILSDIKVRFEYSPLLSQIHPKSKNIIINDTADEKDYAPLIKLNEDLALTSRFGFDTHFSKPQTKAIYKQWMINSLQGLAADKIFIARLKPNTKPAGFVTCKKIGNSHGEIPLIVVDQKYRDKNIGSFLLKNALDYFKSEKLKRVEVVTQGRNAAAQRFYTKNGFLLKETSVFFHLWVNEIKKVN